MKLHTFESFLNESSVTEFNESTALAELSSFVRENIPTRDFKEKELNKGNGISFYRDGRAEFSIDINKMGNGYVHLYLFSQVEVTSQSLADPKATYQTTSARTVKHKKTVVRELFNNIEKAEKKLQTFMSKNIS